MEKDDKADRLIVPVYINEKIVIDMLAIIDDGFSTVSQINYTEHKEKSLTQNAEVGFSTSGTILSKLLKINIGGELNHSGSSGENESVSKEKVHTNVSLLSKFRVYLKENKLLKTDVDIDTTRIGDFIELEGELQKNPLIDYMEHFIDLFRLADIFVEKAPLNKKAQATNSKIQNNIILNQLKAFAGELKHSGTIDFILSDSPKTVVLSVQEQYLTNDNISEIIGGRFKVLGKVISVCRDSKEEVNLLRKTSLHILPEKTFSDLIKGLESDNLNQLALPELRTRIQGPAVIVIPIAIYA